jgi:hypothetical protein
MAFGIDRVQLNDWKQQVSNGQIAFLTHYWLDDRFPHMRTVTKVGCADIEKLQAWCREHQLNPRYIHFRDQYPHFDLFGVEQLRILQQEGLQDHIDRFDLH